MHFKLYKGFYLIVVAVTLVFANVATAQLTVTTVSSSSALARKLAGPGITIVRDSIICNSRASGSFTSVTTPIALDSGILLSTGTATAASGAEAGVTETRFGGTGDADLTSLLGTTSTSADGCALVIYLVPGGDTLSFNYQFGSEEYIGSTCGRYNDAFAFFIAGPGVSTSFPGVNMARVPGTNIPVVVNSINSGTPCTGTGCALSNCTSLGTGSPFTGLYINNAGGTSISYRGYTKVLTAKHWVRPCDTYRLKMAICDAGNDRYDSGVFIEAGSLKASTFFFDAGRLARTINGVPRTIVRGCPGDSVYLKTNRAVGSNTTVRLSYSGAAVSGLDYSRTDSVIFRTGDSVAAYPINALLAGSGSTSATIKITSFSVCGARYDVVADSIAFNIIDQPAFSILDKDTTVCLGANFRISTNATPSFLNIRWSPGTSLDDSTIASPTARITAPITFYSEASLPGSLCPIMRDTIRFSTTLPVANITTPDTTICEGFQFVLRVNGADTLYYNWSPTSGLSTNNAKEPTFAGTNTTRYILTISDPKYGCAIQDTVNVGVVPKFTVTARDTVTCEGNNITMVAAVQPPSGAYTYAWTGPNAYTSVLLNPTITTLTQLNEGRYYLTVLSQGLCAEKASAFITVDPTLPASILAPEITFCQFAPPAPIDIVGYPNVMWYDNAQDSIPTLFAPWPKTDSIGKQVFYAAQISLTSNCLSQRQPIEVTVKPCCNGTLSVPTAFTPNGDGKNDVLTIVKTSDYVVNQFSIFNRWGVRVFEAVGEKLSWDGTFNGEPADMGTYYYVAIVNCINSDKKQLTLKGDIALIR